MVDGKATFTEVFRVFFALLMATIGVSQTSSLGSDSAKAKESASSIFAIIDHKSIQAATTAWSWLTLLVNSNSVMSVSHIHPAVKCKYSEI